jgi:hypothetical protein
MAHKFTHTGIVLGCDNRTRDGYQCKEILRETANFWVTKHGTKYRKHTGSAAGGGSFPMFRLDVTTIKPKE